MNNDFLNDNNDELNGNSDAANEIESENQNENEIDSPNAASEKSDNTELEEEKPRKRKIVKNTAFPTALTVFLVIFILTIVTLVIFLKTVVYQPIFGTWSYTNTYTVTETYDTASSTPDTAEAEYSQRVSYEFTKDGECIVTVGTMSVPGEYYLSTDDDGNNIVSAYVIYGYIPVIYDSFTYEITGNIFTGKKLTLCASDGTVTELTKGEGEDPLVPFDDFTPDEQLYGEWRSDELGFSYKFDKDGYMWLSADDGMVVEHAYTIMDGFILTKYYGQEQYSESLYYTLEDGILTIDGVEFTKTE